MRYVMKQKLLSWGDDFVIKDESGRDAFYVDGKAFSLGNQLSFRDMRGDELVDERLVARDLHEHGEVRPEAVLPVDAETESVGIERPAPGIVGDPQRGDDLLHPRPSGGPAPG